MKTTGYIAVSLLAGIAIGMAVAMWIMASGASGGIAREIGLLRVDTLYKEILLPPDTIRVEGKTTYKKVLVKDIKDSIFAERLLREVDSLYCLLGEVEAEKYYILDTVMAHIDYTQRLLIRHEIVNDRWNIYQEISGRRYYVPIENRTITIMPPEKKDTGIMWPVITGVAGGAAGLLTGVLIMRKGD